MEEQKKQILTAKCPYCFRTSLRKEGDTVEVTCDYCYKTFVYTKPSNSIILKDKVANCNDTIKKNVDAAGGNNLNSSKANEQKGAEMFDGAVKSASSWGCSFFLAIFLIFLAVYTLLTIYSCAAGYY